MNKDNQIMSLLSDIDEEFIDDILEIPQKPVESYGAVNASGKSLFLKFAAPIAACLAVAGAAVGVLAALRGNGAAPVVSEEVTTTAGETLPEEISEEELENCLNYIRTNMNVFVEEEFTPHVLDLDFDGSYEICFFPKYCTQSDIFVFSKIDGSYSDCTAVESAYGRYNYPLCDFKDLRLYDKDGEKYYYYHYYDTINEEKGIAAFVSANKTERLLSYGCYNSEEMNSDTEGRSLRFCKKGDDYISDFEEFQRLWAKYEEVPAIKYEEYWEGEEVTLEGAEMLSDVWDDLPFLQEWLTMRPDHLYEETGEKVIVSQMDCGKDHKVTILGYNVTTYYQWGRNFVSNYKTELVLSDSSGKVLDAQEIYSPESWGVDGFHFDIPFDAVDSCMDVIDFGDNQVILLRGSMDDLCEETILHGVKNGAFCPVACVDLPKEEQFNSHPNISAAYYLEGKNTKNPVLIDNVSKSKYVFDFSSEVISYTVIKGDTLPKDGGEVVNISDYVTVEESQIPFIDLTELDFEEKAQAVLQNSLPKVLFAQETVIAGDNVYNFYMIGENVRRSIEGFHSDEYIYCNNVKTAIFKDGVYLGSVKGIYNYDNPPFPLGTDFDDYIAKGYYCEKYDALLITKLNPLYFSEYGDRCFAAVKDGKLYPNLSGSYKEIDNNPKPEGLESSDEIEIRGNELSCGYYTFRFNFDSSEFGLGEYDYEVYWREEKE